MATVCESDEVACPGVDCGERQFGVLFGQCSSNGSIGVVAGAPIVFEIALEYVAIIALNAAHDGFGYSFDDGDAV